MTLVALATIFSGLAGADCRTCSQGPDKKVVAYFPEWAVWTKSYYVKDMKQFCEGNNPLLTDLVYAFIKNDAAGNVKLFDAYAAVEMRHGHQSVDGIQETWGGPQDKYYGHFGQLRKLKKICSNLSVSVALGGWTLSKHFSTATRTAEKRRKFAKNVADFLGEYRMDDDDSNSDPLFDGVDLDWEYPGGGGLAGNSEHSDDGKNYASFVKELRQALDEKFSKRVKISTASPGGEGKM